MVIIGRSVQWVAVSGRWTRFSVMGSNKLLLNDLKDRSSKSNVIILMIPGNPGNEGFYEDFGRKLLLNIVKKIQENWQAEQNQYVFCTMSHLNHVPLPAELKTSGKHKHRFDLTDQIQHKLDFCYECLPKDANIILIGHSIGCYMMFKILPKLIFDGFNVISSFALFPTIEGLALSPNGQRLYPLLAKLHAYDYWVRPFLVCICSLPKKIKYWLCKIAFPDSLTPLCILNSAVELFDADVVRNIIHMSVDELKNVCDLDIALIERKELIRFYYGTTDKWCPIAYANEMLERLGKDCVTIDEDNCEHAFVVKNGDILAKKLAHWII